MAELNNHPLPSQPNLLMANWFPLLFLVILWILALLLSHCVGSFAVLGFLGSKGSAAYLLTLAGFAFIGNRDTPTDAQTRTAIALTVGAATIFAVYAWGEWPMDKLPNPANGGGNPPAPSTGGGDPLNTVNLFAAVLGVVLAAVALIAQKTAVDARTEAEKARTEAEKARKDILDALDIRTLALSNKLLERALTAKAEADGIKDQAHEIEAQDENFARFLHYGATGLTSMAKFFMDLHKWLLEPRMESSDELIGKAAKLILDLGLLVHPPKTGMEHELKQRLRVEYWQPAGQLLESLLLQGMPSSAPAADSEKVLSKLREVRSMFNEL